MSKLMVGIRLAEECNFSPSESYEDIKNIEISSSNSILDIIELALQSWGIEEPQVFRFEKEWKEKEFTLSIKTSQANDYLTKDNLKKLFTSDHKILLLQLTIEARAFKIINDLKAESNLMNKKRISQNNNFGILTNKYILPLNVLGHFCSLADYTKDLQFLKTFLDMQGFTTMINFIYHPLFQLPIEEEDRRRGSDISVENDLSPNLLDGKTSKKRIFPKISLATKPTIVVHENIPVDNVSNIVKCLSFMLESLASIASAYPNLISSEIHKLSHHICQFLKIDENYYWNVNPSISKSCSSLLTCIAKIIREYPHDKTMKVENEPEWLQIRSLLALHKRPLSYRLHSLECFVSIYSLSSKSMKREMMKTFQRYQITTRNTFLEKGKCANCKFYL